LPVKDSQPTLAGLQTDSFGFASDQGFDTTGSPGNAGLGTGNPIGSVNGTGSAITNFAGFIPSKTCTLVNQSTNSFNASVKVVNTTGPGTALSCTVVDTTFPGLCPPTGSSSPGPTISPSPLTVAANSAMSTCDFTTGVGCTSATGTGAFTSSTLVCNQAAVTCSFNGVTIGTQNATAQCTPTPPPPPSFKAVKTCTPTSPGSNTFNVGVTVFNTDNSGTSTLSCTITDQTYTGNGGTCPPTNPPGPAVALTSPISVGASGSGCTPDGTFCASSTDNGTVTSSVPLCNMATVTCTPTVGGMTLPPLTPQSPTAPCAAAAVKIAKVFATDTVTSGGTVNVTFTLINEGSSNLTHIKFTDVFPTGMTATNVTNVAACGGQYSITGGNTLKFTGGNLNVDDSCSITVTLTAPTTTTSTRVCDQTSVVTTDQVTGQPAFACVTIVPVEAPPTPLSPADAFQVLYAANLDKGDSVINLTNSGTLGGTHPLGDICVNVYVFDPAEELLACCSCLITPNGLKTLSVNNDLLINRLTPGAAPTSVVIKLLSNAPDPGLCDPATPNFQNLVPGMRAWDTTIHFTPGQGLSTIENPFEQSRLSGSELLHITSFCNFIEANGSGFGICNSCRTGALGGARSAQ